MARKREACRIICLVDNSVEVSSSFWGEHGLAFLVESGARRILFDTGQSGVVLRHNLEMLRQSGERVSSIVLSHGHYDHTGGLREAMAWAPHAAVMAHPDIFTERFSQRSEGGSVTLKPIGLPFAREEIASRADLRLVSGVTEVMPGVWLSGEIPRAIDQGVAEPRHVVREGEALRPDPFWDDQALILDTSSGVVLLLGCCHAGLLNTLEHVRRTFGERIHAVVGGTHLHKAERQQLAAIAVSLHDDYRIEKLYLNHCTGAAIGPLMQELGDRVHPCPAGTSLEF